MSLGNSSRARAATRRERDGARRLHSWNRAVEYVSVRCTRLPTHRATYYMSGVSRLSERWSFSVGTSLIYARSWTTDLRNLNKLISCTYVLQVASASASGCLLSGVSLRRLEIHILFLVSRYDALASKMSICVHTRLHELWVENGILVLLK